MNCPQKLDIKLFWMGSSNGNILIFYAFAKILSSSKKVSRDIQKMSLKNKMAYEDDKTDYFICYLYCYFPCILT